FFQPMLKKQHTPRMLNLTKTAINYSAQEVPETSLAYVVLTSTCLGLLILCSIVGNACVIAVVVLERALQNVANYLICSLAVTDLLVSVLVLPMAALYQVLERWTLGQVLCDIFIALDILCCTSSIIHLCVIALDRYWAIVDPINYVNRRTPRRAALLICLTWLVGFSISIPPMLGWRTPEDRSDPDACVVSQDYGYTIYSTFGAFYIPLLLMLFLYWRIFKAARFRIRKRAGKNRPVLREACLTEQHNGLAQQSKAPCRRKIALARERKTVKTLGIIMGTFVLCWLPFFIVTLVLPFCKLSCSPPPTLSAVINWLGYSNSLLNPIIYAFFNKDFQNAFKKIPHCRFYREALFVIAHGCLFAPILAICQSLMMSRAHAKQFYAFLEIFQLYTCFGLSDTFVSSRVFSVHVTI
uniref:5-hydroxytryptamine (serotonin) receptor 1A b n=1 Tax=Eptatretus burgeri TaxID=7764 RepID=A0A8C4NHU4_EPTBU